MKCNCPVCHNPLDVQGTVTRCPDCNRDIVSEARCPECHKPLDVLRACGATDYFCRHGHGLISKKRVEFVPVANASSA